MELLAPAGTMENFIAALESGADAIYLGGKGFNARAHAANFGIEELAEAIRLAHILDVSVSSGEILSIIKEHGGEYLESASIFDVYEGEHIEAGYRSLAYNLQFRSMEGTLNDEDIDGNIQAIIDALAEINCRLR